MPVPIGEHLRNKHIIRKSTSFLYFFFLRLLSHDLKIKSHVIYENVHSEFCISNLTHRKSKDHRVP